MSKLIVVDETADTRIPFLRGMLTKSLQRSGLEFVEAYRLASEIREDLDELDTVTTDDLRQRIADALEVDYPDVVLRRYQKQTPYTEPIEVVDEEGHENPFSRGTFSRRLMGCGMPMDLYGTVTREIHDYLIGHQIRKVTTRELIALTYRSLRSNGNQKSADQYLVWCDFNRKATPLIILIGGVPGSGKSTIATELAGRLSIVRTQSTDMLREVMRALIPRRVSPSLHESSFTAGRAQFRASMRKTKDLDLLIGGYQMQSDMVAVACESVLNRAVNERVSLILEGVHMRPGLFRRFDKAADAVVVPVILAVLQQKRLKENIRGRAGEKRAAKRYLDHFDEIWQLQTAILSDADAADIEIVDSADIDDTVTEICKMVTDTIAVRYKGNVKALRRQYDV